jgi:mono/diheme cytochrome c family protein
MAATNALAQPSGGDPGAGRRFAETHCTGCHQAGEPEARAPGFAAIAQMPSTTSLSLRAFLLTSHPTMPNIRLTPEEVDDVVAYILSLKRR